MSLEAIRRVLLEAIQDSTPEVIAIKGKWGTGKTYFWNEFIKENKEKISAVFEYYSYVSTFGITSLNKLKTEIYVKANKPKDIGDEIKFTPASLKKNWKQHFKSLIPIAQNTKLSGKVEDINISLDSSSDIFNALMNTTFKSTLIVIDDLERLSKDIDYSDLLGFISQLKNEKKCKIIIILNDEEIKDDYHKIKEKIVDKDIKFEPTLSELCQIGLIELDFGQEACENAIWDIGCKNIRTIFKIKYFINLLKSLLKKLTPQFANDAIRTLCIICYCHWENDGTIPDLTFIIDSSARDKYGKMMTGDEKSTNTPKFDYLFNLDFDMGLRWRATLSTIVKNGYLEGSNIEEIIEKNILTGTQEAALDEWTKTVKEMHNDLLLFQKQEDWLDKLWISSNNALGLYSLNDLDWVIRIFRKCGEEEKADKLIEAYKTKYPDEQRRYIPDLYFGEILDDKFIAMLDLERSRLKKNLPLVDALTHMATQNSWDPEFHIPPIKAATENELYEIFKNTKGRELYKIINYCLRYDTDNLTTKTKNALLRIQAEGNELTKLQLAKYNLDRIK